MYENEDRENKKTEMNSEPEREEARVDRDSLEDCGKEHAYSADWTTPSGNSGEYGDDSHTERSRGRDFQQSQREGQYGQRAGRANRPENRPDNHFDGRGNGRPRRSLARKAAGVTAAAILFGAVSGSVMAGINVAGTRLASAYGITSQQTASAPTVPSTTTAVPQSRPVSTAPNVSTIAAEAMPSVVAINDTMTVVQQNMFGMPQTYQAKSSGSGIIVGQNDTELLIATNNHVVDGATDLSVTFVDNKVVSAAIKGTDSASDLAIVAVQLSDIESDTMSKIKVATLGDSNSLEVGEQVIAIGNALGYGQSVTVGYVSALNREIQDDQGLTHTYIQTDAAINPGNSGGALLDMNGNVIGINAAKTASTEVEGIGFAIPISKAQDILNNLMTKKTRVAVAEDAQGYLGIQGTNIDATASQEYGMPVGIYVYKIVDGGAAASSDLKEKDIITKFDGQSVTNMEELKQMLTYYEGGTTVTLTVESLQNGAYVEHEVQVTLGTKPAAQQQ